MNQVILLKYGEFFLKGLNKKIFEKKLITDIKYKLKNICKYKLFIEQSTIMITTEQYIIDKVYNLISENVFGISYICKAFICEKKIEVIKEISLKCFETINYNNEQTFKICTKRADKTFLLKSFELSKEIGTIIVEKYNGKVNIKKPDIVLNIEIRQEYSFIYFDNQKSKGLGGLPLNSSGEALSMISCGFDSPVASYMMLKRGLQLKYIHFYSYPYTSENSKTKVINLCKRLSVYGNECNLYIVNFTKIQETIKKHCSERLITILTRRSMFRIAEKFAQSLSNDCAIITGDSLGQVASQTLRYINILDKNMVVPILRPLIGMDKVEIIDISKKIQTYPISILPYDDCCTVFTPKHPKLSVDYSEVILEENKINISLLEEEAIIKIIYES